LSHSNWSCKYNELAIGKIIFTGNYSGLKKIIVVDDCSKDNSYKIAKEFQKKYPSKILVVQTPKNTGNAAGAKNYGAKFVDTELIGFTDDDSFPSKDSMEKMVGFFNDAQVGAVTSKVLVKNRNNFLAGLQAIEYKIIAFTRKLLGFVGGIYVTNGPLSIYRKNIFDRIHGFDESNLTEDIEITWHIVREGYLVHMSLSTQVYTVAPETFKSWFKQRIRWNVGGLQTINKYKTSFLKCGMLGTFILPFFTLSWIIAIFGLLIMIYRVVRTIIIRYLSTIYSVKSQTAILTLQDINLSVNVLFFFGLAILIMSVFFTILALLYSKETNLKRHSIFSILVYMFIYMLLYPVVLITSVYKYLRGYNKW